MYFLRSLLLTFITLVTLVAAFGQKTERFVPNEILVKFDVLSEAALSRSVFEGFGAEFVEKLGDLGWHRVKLPGGMSVHDAETRFRRHPSVLAVQPNYFYSLLTTPNDPQYPTPGMWGLPKISAPDAWKLTTGSSEVVVAVIDTGMRLTHEDLAANLWINPDEIPGNGIDDDGNGFIDDVHGWDFRFDDNDPSDQHGHGTHVAGTIGAVGNNGIGTVGVNWNVRLMPIKIYSQAANDTTSAMLINAYNYVRIMKLRGVNIRVTNNSYGGCNEACGFDQATKDAIDALGDAGVLNIFAAGNNNRNTDEMPFYPGSYDSPSILNVANSTSADVRASTSNFGVATVDLAAPGSAILSTTNGSDSSYGGSSGTSMAAPHVAGAAALLAAHRPDLSAASLKATLMNTVDELPAWQGLVRTGGRLNVFAAMQSPTVCTFVPETESIFVPTKGGVFTINVEAPPNCDHTVRASRHWIQTISPRNLSGSGPVQFRVTVNNTRVRSGELLVGGVPVVITQSRGGKE